MLQGLAAFVDDNFAAAAALQPARGELELEIALTLSPYPTPNPALP
jgi:hypothetical protein